MNKQRRLAFKKIATSLGLATSIPTLMTLLEGCTEQKRVNWKPSFFYQEERYFIARLVDIFIPKTDIPSATEMGIHVFIDRYISAVFPKKQQRKLKDGNNFFVNQLLKDSDIGYVNGLDDDDIIDFLDKILKIDIEKEEEYLFDVYVGNKLFPPKEESSRFYFAHEVRKLTVLGYFTTELIGKHVLPYQLKSRTQKGCVDISELSSEKSWSLDPSRLPFINHDFILNGL